MRKTHRNHRIAIVALSASLVLPIAPVFGQDAQPAPVVVAPPPPVSVAPPPPVAVTPPPIVATPPAARPAPPPVARTATPPAPAARETRTATRAARPAPRARGAAPAAPEAGLAPVAIPPSAPIAEIPPPAEGPPVDALPPVFSDPPVAATGIVPTERGSTLPWLIAGLALLAGLIAFGLFRRRSRVEAYEGYYEEQPALAEEPVAAATPDYQPAIVAPLPSFRRDEPVVAAELAEIAVESDLEEVNEVETSAADIAALGAADTAHRDRPWLEMLMRPIRAGANGEDTVVEFSLTVGNTGGVPAEDVRISAWMLPSEGSEMESLLIEPPAGATLSETRIEAGDGATVEATVTLPREAFDRAMLPVVVTDARYRLPGGGEGRTSASFAVGLPIGDELVPFPANAASGLNEGVEARVHGDVEHV